VVADGRVTVLRHRSPVRLARIPEHAALPVPVMTALVDGDSAALDRLLDPMPAALVVAATGGGNTAPWLLDGAERIMSRDVPVALTTRCPSGRVRSGYGFPGGSSRWWEAGAIFSGTLDPLKTRVLLALGVGSGAAADELADLCRGFGGGRIRSG
jgi:L-asparaginase